MTKKTVKQVKAFIARNQRQYAAGTLPAWKIEKLEGIPGWTWDSKKPRTFTGVVTRSFPNPNNHMNPVVDRCEHKHRSASTAHACASRRAGDWKLVSIEASDGKGVSLADFATAVV